MFTAVLATAAVTGCSGGPAARRGLDRVIVVLVDLSASTGDQGTESLYSSQFQTLLRSIQPGDALLVDLIQNQSIVRSSFPINERFNRFRPVHEGYAGSQRDEIDFLTRLRQRKGQLAAEFRRLLASPRSTQTDIMSGLLAAEQAIKNFPEAKGRYLILISDMIEDSGRYDFSRPGLTAADFDRILEREIRSKGLPDLRGVQVLVTGAGGPNSAQWLKIRDFWTSYITAAGGHLSNYGHTLVDIPLASSTE